MNATTLKERVINAFKAHGIEWNEKNDKQSAHKHVIGKEGRFIYVEETHRHNGTAENVTVSMRIYEYVELWGENSGISKCIMKAVKVPKNASDRVIENRIAQVLTAFNS